MKSCLSIILLALFAVWTVAAPIENITEVDRDGEHVVQRSISDEGKLLYRYSLTTDVKTNAKTKEGHTFYLNDKIVFGILDNERRRVSRYTSVQPGSVFHTIDKDRGQESVWLTDHAVPNGGWLFIREGSGFFRYEPVPEKDLDGEK